MSKPHPALPPNYSFISASALQAAATPQRPPGRPSTYNPEIAITICERIATTPQSLARLCAAPDLPSVATVIRWLREYPDFRDVYVFAKEAQIELIVEDAIQIADDKSGDLTVTSEGKTLINNAAVQRSRLQVNLRKWFATRLMLRKYGHDAVSPESQACSQSQNPSLTQLTNSASNFDPNPNPQPQIMTEPMRLELIERRRRLMAENGDLD
jgi:hypothetical protein